MKHLSLLLLTFFLCAGTAGADGESASAPPNIVVVLIDDMGWSDLSCFAGIVSQPQSVHTPHIDRLAAEGQRFTSFYVSAPLCSPSRCGIMTGQYPQRWKITSYLASRQENIKRGTAQWLDLKAPSFPRLFQEKGYAAGHFGKWHLGGQRDVGDAPLITEYGFDKSLTNFEGLGDRILPLKNAFDGKEPEKHALGSDKLGRGKIEWVERHRVTGKYTAAALDFIKNAEKEKKPFYVNLWLDDVHSPFFPSNSGDAVNGKKERYHRVLAEMDTQLSPLFDYVRGNPALRDNTLILLLSDNGPEPGAGSSLPFKGGKGQLYEGGIRSPLIVWGPGLLGKKVSGTQNGQAVFTSIDFAPALLKIAGIPVPQEYHFDGENFADVLLGKTAEKQRVKPVFWQRPPDRPGPQDNPLPDLALRWNEWKFLMQFDGSHPQLYRIVDDPSESQNLADKEPQLVASFRKQLQEWREEINSFITAQKPSTH
ncbi:MAG: sulfatase-like hydrolase/transferase [Planctomycetaceae bacterium]|jgi:uncharacterized sulfatase|nr:sulfatase-like hydrolase/transferase [Planctomycetaceae bacterium]